MTEYTYNNLIYTKRPIIENILLHIAADTPAAIGTATYLRDTMTTKGAELASQADACPMIGRDLIIPVYNRIRKEPGMRARDVETGSAIAAADFAGYTPENAACQIACGTLANIAPSFSEDTADTMLSQGILPLISAQTLPVGTLLYIKGIRSALTQGSSRLDAYQFLEGDFVPVSMSVPVYSPEKLARILEDQLP